MTFLLVTANFPSLLSKMVSSYWHEIFELDDVKKVLQIIEFGEIFHPTELFHSAHLSNLEKFAILQNYSNL